MGIKTNIPRIGLSLLLTIGLLSWSFDALAKDSVKNQPSRHGRFSVVEVQPPNKNENEHCEVFFTRGKEPKTPLFVVPDCNLGWMTVKGVTALGSLRFPVTIGDTEFHLFEIPSARGGNAIHTMDYWAAVITSSDIWSQELDIGEPTVARTESSSPTLILEEPATAHQPGARLTIRFGKLTKTALPKLAAWVVKREEKTLVGDLSGGYGYTGRRPVLVESPGRETIIDEDGSCKLPDLSEDWGRARLRISISTWNDGRKVVRCLSVRRLAKRR